MSRINIKMVSEDALIAIKKNINVINNSEVTRIASTDTINVQCTM